MSEQVQQSRRGRFSLTTFAALKYRDYRFIWLAELGSSLAQQGEMLTRSWLILEMTGSGIALATVHVARALGTMTVTPIAGVLADRIDRRLLLTLATLVNITFFLLMALLILVDLITVWYVVASAAISGAVMSVKQTSTQAVIPGLVPREGIMNAVALNSVNLGSSRILGPLVAGFMIAFAGVQGSYFLLAGLLVFPIILYGLMRPLKLAVERRQESFFASFKAGLRFAAHNPSVRVVLLVQVTCLTLAMPFLQLMPLYVTDVLEMGPETLGVILSFPAILSVAGGLFAASIGDYRYKGRLMYAAVMSPCIAAIILSQTSMVWTAMVAVGVHSALSSQFQPSSRTALMKATPDDLRGRVVSLMSFSQGGGSIGMMLYGLMADFGGIQMSFLLFGSLGAILLTSYFVSMRSFRQLS